MTCPRCRTPLAADADILADAQRQGIRLDFLPLRCRNAHSARLPLPRPRTRFIPLCRFCGLPVLERTPHGKQFMNHPACTKTGKTKQYAAQPAGWGQQRYVEVEV